MTTAEYIYDARLLRVIDGDTVDLAVDLGFGTWRHERFRLYGINTPEKTGVTKARGMEAAARMIELFDLAGGRATVKTRKDRDKYGRYLVEIVGDIGGVGVNFGEELIRLGLAVEYFGGKRESSFLENAMISGLLQKVLERGLNDPEVRAEIDALPQASSVPDGAEGVNLLPAIPILLRFLPQLLKLLGVELPPELLALLTKLLGGLKPPKPESPASP